MKSTPYLMLLIVLGDCCLGHLWAAVPSGRTTLHLREGWRIQSSAYVKDGGEVVSTSRYKPVDWYPATVPATVLAVLVSDKVYADPYFGPNLRAIPGTQYPIGEVFSNLMMPPESPFRSSWWYRTEFRDPGKLPGRRIWLQFDGINFRANVWLNGARIADSTQVAGAYRSYEFDISEAVIAGSTNVLAVEVFPPQPTDLAINWVNINAAPADKNMGLWRSVRIITTGPVAIRHPHVISHLDLPSMKAVHLTITVDLRNAVDHAIKGILLADIETIEISQEFELGPHEVRNISLTPERFPRLNISRPRVWWPWQMGQQPLYELRLEFVSNNNLSDVQELKFGIREATSELDAANHRLFRVNGQKILLRGGGWWSSDIMLRPSPERQEWEIRYARDLNLNALRMDGKFEDEHFLELTDQYGLLLLPGWCCCDQWERWNDWDEEDYKVASASLVDTLRNFRNHPSVLAWLLGDDNPPPPRVEGLYKDIVKDSNWPNPVLSSATATPTTLSENTGVKMNGPYNWIPPIYWYADKERGGAFGLATEVGPGAVIPPVESLRKFLPASHLWPPDEVWVLHEDASSPGVFLNVFTQALEARYGRANTLEDYTKKAQLMSYEAQRAMFEAYGRNKYIATGILMQMMNNGWPQVVWHIYDYYLRPAGAYFGTKKACEPLHIQYSYDNRAIVAVNSYYRSFTKLRAKATVYDLTLRERFAKEVTFDALPDSSNSLFTIPEIAGLSTTYFIDLRMADSSGMPITSNFYWLSTKPDVLDPERSTWLYTPTKVYADYTGLQNLAPAQVLVSGKVNKEGKEGSARIAVENPGKQLAFFLTVRLVNQETGEELLPILLEDGYFSLLPGERKEVTAKFNQPPETTLAVEIEGWNVARQINRVSE